MVPSFIQSRIGKIIVNKHVKFWDVQFPKTTALITFYRLKNFYSI